MKALVLITALLASQTTFAAGKNWNSLSCSIGNGPAKTVTFSKQHLKDEARKTGFKLGYQATLINDGTQTLIVMVKEGSSQVVIGYTSPSNSVTVLGEMSSGFLLQGSDGSADVRAKCDLK